MILYPGPDSDDQSQILIDGSLVKGLIIPKNLVQSVNNLLRLPALLASCLAKTYCHPTSKMLKSQQPVTTKHEYAAIPPLISTIHLVSVYSMEEGAIQYDQH